METREYVYKKRKRAFEIFHYIIVPITVVLGVVTAAMLLLLLPSKPVQHVKTIADLSYEKYPDGIHEVYVLENTRYVPFLVLTNNYDGKTLLLRKDIQKYRRLNGGSSYYFYSEIDDYLNKSYTRQLIDLQPFLETVGVQIFNSLPDQEDSGRVQIVNRRVFLLSAQEVGIGNSAPEGKRLSFFEEASHRIAFYEDHPASWWLRTPVFGNNDMSFVVRRDNFVEGDLTIKENGIRPAFCVASSLEVKPTTHIIRNQTVYIFDIPPTHAYY